MFNRRALTKWHLPVKNAHQIDTWMTEIGFYVAEGIVHPQTKTFDFQKCHFQSAHLLNMSKTFLVGYKNKIRKISLQNANDI